DSAVHRDHAGSFDAAVLSLVYAACFVPADSSSSIPADYVSAGHVLVPADRDRILLIMFLLVMFSFLLTEIESVDYVFAGHVLVFQKILSQLNQVQARPDNDDINLKFLRALPSSWSQVGLALKTRGGLDSMSFDDLYNKLRSLELDVRIGHSYSVKAAAAPTHSAFIGTAISGQSLQILISSVLFHQYLRQSGRSDNIKEMFCILLLLENEQDQDMIYEDFDHVDQFEKKAGRKMNYNNQQPARFDRRKTNQKLWSLVDSMEHSQIKLTENKTGEVETGQVLQTSKTMHPVNSTQDQDQILPTHSYLKQHLFLSVSRNSYICLLLIGTDPAAIETYQSVNSAGRSKTILNGLDTLLVGLNDQTPVLLGSQFLHVGVVILVNRYEQIGIVTVVAQNYDKTRRSLMIFVQVQREALYKFGGGDEVLRIPRELISTPSTSLAIFLSDVSAGSPSGGSDPAGGNPADSFEPADESNPAVSSSVSADIQPLYMQKEFYTSFVVNHWAQVQTPHEFPLNSPAPSDVCMDQLSSGIFTSSSYDDDFSATLTNLAPVVDAISSIKKVNTIHPSVTDTCNYSLLQFLTRSRSSKIQLEPTSIAKALEDPDWVAAMQEEMQQFLNQQVWKLVPLPNGKHAIGTKWILKNKRDARGIVVRNKARIDAIILELLLHLIWDILVLSVKALYGLPSSTLEPVQVPDIKYFTDFILMLKCGQEIFKYLKGQPKLGLWYPKDSPFQLEAYSDSDYALVLMVIGNPLPVDVHILWQKLIFMAVQKQTIEANFFNTEAKYDAALAVVHKESGIRNQLLDYGFNFMNTKIFIDNQSTICIVKNPVFHQRTKHIEIRHHFIRDANEKNLIQVDRLDSAGRTLFLLIVIISAGCFLSAGSYGLCCWFRVHADGHTSAGGFSCFADGVVCSTV
ncbi:hypothetical protein Tco_0768180, partial [Tanacetum coccineum]